MDLRLLEGVWQAGDGLRIKSSAPEDLLNIGIEIVHEREFILVPGMDRFGVHENVPEMQGGRNEMQPVNIHKTVAALGINVETGYKINLPRMDRIFRIIDGEGCTSIHRVVNFETLIEFIARLVP